MKLLDETFGSGQRNARERPSVSEGTSPRRSQRYPDAAGQTNRYEGVVGPVIEGYEKAINALEAKLSQGQAVLRRTGGRYGEKETRGVGDPSGEAPSDRNVCRGAEESCGEINGEEASTR